MAAQAPKYRFRVLDTITISKQLQEMRINATVADLENPQASIVSLVLCDNITPYKPIIITHVIMSCITTY
jgi:hypothetical protein